MAKGKDIQKGVQQEEREGRMALGRRNYLLMLIGLGLIVAGFLLMAGGGSDDPAVFNEQMFSFRRVTLAPVVVVVGFVFEVWAIMSKKR
jgi:cytochrome bd-type quinol oxidase subunit 2